MAPTFPIPSAQDEAAIYPPFTGIKFSFVTIDPVTKKSYAIEETMIEEGMSRNYPARFLEIVFGNSVLGMTPQQVRFLVKSWLAVFAAQAAFIENRKLVNPPKERPESLCPPGTVDTVLLDCIQMPDNGDYVAQLVKKGTPVRKQYRRQEVMLTTEQIIKFVHAPHNTLNWPNENEFIEWVSDHEI